MKNGVIKVALTLLASADGFASVANAMQIGETVPFVGCPADGQLGPLEPPAEAPQSIQENVPVSKKLAYYKAEKGPGGYAPKQWHCRAWYGSSGSFLLITPTPILPPYFPPPRISGPAVLIRSANGGTSGRFDVAITAARLFPREAREFIESVENEHRGPDSDFHLKPYPHDQLTYLDSSFVQFTTPGGFDGLGTTGLLDKDALPSEGLVRLYGAKHDHSLSVVQIRLPAKLQFEADGMLQLEKVCLQHADDC